MVGEDRVVMSAKELRRVHVIRQVREKRLTQGEAGTRPGVTDRQIRRLLRRVERRATGGWYIGDAESRRTGGFPRRGRRM